MKVRKEETRAARLRPDQIDAIERLIEIVPELDWSSAIRRGLDLLIRELKADLLQERKSTTVSEVVRALQRRLDREAGTTPRTTSQASRK